MNAEPVIAMVILLILGLLIARETRRSWRMGPDAIMLAALAISVWALLAAVLFSMFQ